MYRYPVGRGRWIATAAAVVLLVGCVLPWYTAGGQVGNLPAVTGNAFEASGILVFLVALATFALVTLPFAAGDRPVGLDRWPPYAILFLVGVLGVVLRAIDLWGRGVLGLPDRSPGLWLVGIGLIMLGRAAFEVFQAPQNP